jgi:holo-[acyl-carrier protein] synthase
MILGLGIDFLETKRVERELAQGEWLPDDGIFTAEETRYCNSVRCPARRYTICFAAKEATLKALGVRAPDLAMFREVEVEFGAGDVCGVRLHNRLKIHSERLGVRRIRIATTGHFPQAGAIVILED